jgi:hypothetical protein
MKFAYPFLAILFATLNSCSSFYFSNPQPSDRTDKRSIPKALHGKWWMVESPEDQPDRSKQESYVVEGKKIWSFESTEEAVIDRILLLSEIADSAANKQTTFPSLREEKYDSVNHKIDTIDNYILHKGLIHALKDDGLDKGRSFRRTGDTIRFTRVDTTCFELGHYLSVRTIGDGLYVLNFRDGADRKTKGWWEVSILEVKGDLVILHAPGEKMKQHPALIHVLNNGYYLDLDMTAADMRKMLTEEMFTSELGFKK